MGTAASGSGTRWVLRTRGAAVAATLALVGWTAGCGAAPANPAASNSSASASYANDYAQAGKHNSANLTAAPMVVKLGDPSVNNGMSFVPDTLTVARGTPVTLRLQNVGNVVHNFSIDAFHVSVTVQPGQTATAAFTPSAPGTYYFYCDIAGHAAAGMVGKLTVK